MSATDPSQLLQHGRLLEHGHCELPARGQGEPPLRHPGGQADARRGQDRGEGRQHQHVLNLNSNYSEINQCKNQLIC